MITDRSLRKWRRESLSDLASVVDEHGGVDQSKLINFVVILNKRVLRLTQELMDLNILHDRRKS